VHRHPPGPARLPAPHHARHPNRRVELGLAFCRVTCEGARPGGTHGTPPARPGDPQRPQHGRAPRQRGTARRQPERDTGAREWGCGSIHPRPLSPTSPPMLSALGHAASAAGWWAGGSAARAGRDGRTGAATAPHRHPGEEAAPGAGKNSGIPLDLRSANADDLFMDRVSNHPSAPPAEAAPASGGSGLAAALAMVPHTGDSRCCCPSREASDSRDIMEPCGTPLYEEVR
jgi:hypothetical protein